MPAVPTFGNQVNRSRIPGVRADEGASPDTYGAGIARGLSQAAGVIGEVIQHEKLQADRTAVTAADDQRQQWLNDALYHPENGAFAKKGVNALGISGTVLADYDKEASRIGASLNGKRQQLAFTESSRQGRLALQQQLNRHEAVQRDAYQDQADESRINTAIQTAALNYGDPIVSAQQKQTIDAVLLNQKDRKGFDDLTLGLARQNATSGLHAAVVGRLLLDNDYAKAGQYLAQNATEIKDPVVEQLQRRILLEENQGAVRQEKLQKSMIDDVIKEGDKRLSDGTLDAQWIASNRSILPHEEYRYFLRKLAGDDDSASGPRDKITYADLRERSGSGEDVRADARAALVSGAIRSSDYDRILGEVEQERPGWYKRGTNFITTSSAVSDLNPDPAAAQRKASMLDDWYQWSLDNKGATDEQATNAYQRIVKEYAIVDYTKMTLMKRSPQFLVGARNLPNFDATEAATVKAFKEGAITRQEFDRQALLIKEWRDAFHKTQQKQQAK